MLTTSPLFLYMARPVCLMPAYNFVPHVTRDSSVRSGSGGCPIGAVSWATPCGGGEPGTLVLFPNVSTTNALATSIVIHRLGAFQLGNHTYYYGSPPNFQHGAFITASMTTRPPTGTSLLRTMLCLSSSQVSIGRMRLAKVVPIPQVVTADCTSRAFI